ERVNRSIEELNKPSTPTGMSHHRESNSSPHKFQIPALRSTFCNHLIFLRKRVF
ncbi:11477_t:CDS:1, partial [Gigaspora margarita]